MTADPRIALLTGAARALAEELGYDIGLKLVKEFGGTAIDIPNKPRPRWRVWQVMGEEAAKALSRLYAVDKRIEVPIGGALNRHETYRRIIEHPGSHNEAARAFGVTRRWVKMVRRTERQGLGPLFDGLSKRT